MRSESPLPHHVLESLARATVLLHAGDDWDTPPASLLLRARLAWDEGMPGGIPGLSYVPGSAWPLVERYVAWIVAGERRRYRGETPFDDSEAKRRLWLVHAIDPTDVIMAATAKAAGRGDGRVRPRAWRLYELRTTRALAGDYARRLLGTEAACAECDELTPPETEHGRWWHQLAWDGGGDVDDWQDALEGWYLDTSDVWRDLGTDQQPAPSRDDLLLRSDVNTWQRWVDQRAIETLEPGSLLGRAAA